MSRIANRFTRIRGRIYLRRKSADKNTDIRIFLLKERHICFNFRTVVTWFEQFAARLFIRITDRHLVPNTFSDYSLDWTSPNLSLVDLAVVCIT